MANEGGGRIILGVTDERPRQIVGSKAFQQPERTRKGLCERIPGGIDFEEINHSDCAPDSRVLVFSVPSRPVGVAIQHDGHRWVRKEDSLVEMCDDRLRRIYSESGHDFSADVCASVTPGDLDGLAIENFRERWIAKAEKAGDQEQARRVRSLDDAQLLEDVGASYVRVYTFLSHIFDYGNSELEKRAIFYKHLTRLLKFGRERQGVDLSEVRLTHHNLKNRGKQKMNLREGETPQLEPLSAAGSGQVREKQTAYLSEIIAKVNNLFEDELTENDKLVYVNDVLKGKLLESETLQQQARNNTKEQFANSPDLKTEILTAVMQALDAHTEMSTQALNSQTVQEGLRDILIGPSKLYESLRETDPTPPEGAA